MSSSVWHKVTVTIFLMLLICLIHISPTRTFLYLFPHLAQKCNIRWVGLQLCIFYFFLFLRCDGNQSSLRPALSALASFNPSRTLWLRIEWSLADQSQDSHFHIRVARLLWVIMRYLMWILWNYKSPPPGGRLIQTPVGKSQKGTGSVLFFFSISFFQLAL